ncbi:Ketosteroid isomerase homolog [Catalinimonas alkaloidigena]|uniref:Ketosteroid isomerase homolog n=1 Tax=Catalinimonas alkaloidigena TaxID=1075417 RepID=A0A1G9DHA0_9BACT|nr:DUF4440 domain-containing protein [Catalinimonas alkaloidigena]SDK63229.1 Ketosteroid isomerase homolog [Catalinimonas alkaloidigena]
MRVKHLVFMLGLLWVSQACQPQPETDVQAVADTLARRAAEFSRAYERGDLDAMLAVYTNDAVIFPHNMEAIRGKEALGKYWRLPDGRQITHHQSTSEGVEVQGNLASDHGHYEISGRNGAQEWGPVHGKYVIVWRREADGQWRMHLDMWNGRPFPGD